MYTAQNGSDLLLGSRPSFSEEQKTRQHQRLSAATSLPSSATRSPTAALCCNQRRRSSVDDYDVAVGCSCSPSPASSLGRRSGNDERGERSTTMPARYKTELCRTYAEHGACRYGDKCQFAHGRDELRAVARHPKYKTDLCRTYHTIGLCPYGPRCHFIHNEDDVGRLVTPPPPPQLAVEQRRNDADLAARELELRLALQSLYERERPTSQSSLMASSSYRQLNTNSAVTVAAPAARQCDVPLMDRRQSLPATPKSVQSSMRPVFSSMGVSSPPPLVAGALDSVGNSPSPASSSAADDDDGPPAPSPTTTGGDSAEDARRQLVDVTAASHDRLTALLILAAKLQLLWGSVVTH